MDEGRQKSKRLSYMAKFKCEVTRCAKEKGNRKAAVDLLELMKTTFDCGGITRQRSASVRHQEGNSLDPRNDDFLKFMMQSSRFFKRCKTGLFVSYDLLCEEAIKKARFFTIPRSRFKASNGGAIRFMHQMGLALWRRMICKKMCCISNVLDGSEDDIVWEGNVEDKDDRDWVESTDNDSVMSNDGESDE
jgi:hypothetical protein